MDSTGSIPLRPNLLHDPVPGSALDIVAYASRENGVAILTEGQLVADATVAATRRPVLHGPTKVVPFQGSSPGTGSKAQKFIVGLSLLAAHSWGQIAWRVLRGCSRLVWRRE